MFGVGNLYNCFAVNEDGILLMDRHFWLMNPLKIYYKQRLDEGNSHENNLKIIFEKYIKIENLFIMKWYMYRKNCPFSTLEY